MLRPATAGALLWTLGILSARPLPAQSPPTPVFSIGQPPIWRYHAALQGTLRPDDRASATLTYGVFRAISRPPSNAFNPVLGVVGVTLEGFGSFGQRDEAGLRGMLTSQMLATSIGADWDVRNSQVDMILSWQSAIRRGGLLGRGSMLRVDWIPKRSHTVRVGVAAPLFQPLAGRTRPGRTSARLPHESPAREQQARAPLAPAARQYAQSIEASARVVAAYSDLYRDRDVQLARVSGYRDAMTRLHSALDGLFRSVGLDSAGAASAALRARHAVLDRVLIPVDSVFGRVKDVDVQRLGERGVRCARRVRRVARRRQRPGARDRRAGA